MTHKMKLNDEPFNKIATGSKNIELRLYDEKRQLIKVGDNIVFSNKTGKQITVKVIALHKFSSFKELYENLDLLKCGYNETNINKASYTDMEEYYSKGDIEKYGVAGIEIELIL